MQDMLFSQIVILSPIRSSSDTRFSDLRAQLSSSYSFSTAARRAGWTARWMNASRLARMIHPNLPNLCRPSFEKEDDDEYENEWPLGTKTYTFPGWAFTKRAAVC
jgi:hypothetical protein